MAKGPRRGSENSETRTVLLDVTERIMRSDGYAAVSSRRVAGDAGVTPALVHYYFGTIDDLFLAVLRRRSDQQFERHQRFLESERPLRALWDWSIDPAGTALLMEFMALANHRKVIRKEFAAHAARFRRIQLEALGPHLEKLGVDLTETPPEAIIVLLVSVSRTLVMERALGIDIGLDETLSLIERHLDQLEG